MKEILKVKIGDSSLSLDNDAYGLLEDWLGEVERTLGKEKARESELEVAKRILSLQSQSTVVEVSTVENIITSLGYPEGYNTEAGKVRGEARATSKATQAQQVQTTQPQTNSAMGCLAWGLKAIGWTLGIAWLVAAIGLLIAFIILVCVGFFDTTYLTGYSGMSSPVLFGGLVCAVCVLFMGIVADVWFRLLRGKPISWRKVLVSGIIWLIFTIWLGIATLRNAEKWSLWAYEAEHRVELWEDEVDNWSDNLEESIESWEDNFESQMEIWEDSFENQMDHLEEQMENLEEQLELGLEATENWDSTLTINLKGGLDILKLERLCTRFNELYLHDTAIERELYNGREVIIRLRHTMENGSFVRKAEIETEDGTLTATAPVKVRSANY